MKDQEINLEYAFFIWNRGILDKTHSDQRHSPSEPINSNTLCDEHVL